MLYIEINKNNFKHCIKPHHHSPYYSVFENVLQMHGPYIKIRMKYSGVRPFGLNRAWSWVNCR